MSAKILLMRQDHMGDVLLMTPLIRALAKGGASVSCVCRRAVMPVFIGNPHLAKSHALEDIAADIGRAPWALARWIRGEGFDTYILPFPSHAALIWAGLLGGARRRFTAGGGILSRACGYRQVKTGLPAVARYYAEAHLDFATALGFERDGTGLDWMIQDDERQWAIEFLARANPLGRPVVGIHPGCGGNTCNLAPSEYSRLAMLLLKNTDVAILVTGGLGETGPMADGVGEGKEDRVIDTTGQLTLRQLGALIGQMDALVAPSTGPLHIAAALGIPTVSPFCSRLYLCSQVWGNPNPNALHVTPPLAACESWDRERGGFCDFRGMISAEELADGVRQILAGAPGGRGRG